MDYLYLDYFNTYSALYGSLGAMIILMRWFYLMGAAILIGGEVKSIVVTCHCSLVGVLERVLGGHDGFFGSPDDGVVRGD
ncbi:MAG: YihY/virulence factor BrkB family protein [Acidobacteriota bacterium]|nr:YihY/virulence factor BrkB family protein [Acidobacteriota bacterium]